VIGLLTAHRQRRRRITPNTNTSTTTMISTHNHVDMAASLVGAGQFKLTLLPPTRASNSVTARPPPRPGSTAALRAGSQEPDTPRPARRSGGLAGRGASPTPSRSSQDIAALTLGRDRRDLRHVWLVAWRRSVNSVLDS
jgi:hypothetical protein